MPQACASGRIYTIQGQPVELPVVVREASSGAATYLADAAFARSLLPGEEIDVIEILPGRTLCSLAVIDYKDNDLGDYNEVSIAFFVRSREESPAIPYLGDVAAFLRGRSATYIHHLPVTQSFTCEAGRSIWGFPKSVESIEFDYEPRQVCCRLDMDGQHVLTLRVPRGGHKVVRDAEMITYSYIEGIAHKTVFTSGAEGFGLRFGAARLELGSHPIAQELRALGLSRHALMTTWMEKMHGSFQVPRKL